jgi:hypothetical protein
VHLHHLAVGDDLGARAGGAQQRARGQADEGIAAEALAADDRLQQEAVRLATGQLQVQRQRGFQVGKGLGDQGMRL